MERPVRKESKLVFYTNKLGELVLVDVMLLIACIPVITVVPAFSAMHYVLLKILRDEETGVIKAFWKSFRENLRQGVVLSILYLALFAGQIAFFWCAYQKIIRFDALFLIAVAVLTFLTSVSFQWVCIMLSRYECTVIGAIRNAFRIAVGKPLTSLSVVFISYAPFLGLLLLPRLLPMMLFLSFSVCGLLQTMLYRKVFAIIEEKEETPALQTESEEQI